MITVKILLNLKNIIQSKNKLLKINCFTPLNKHLNEIIYVLFKLGNWEVLYSLNLFFFSPNILGHLHNLNFFFTNALALIYH